MKKIFDYVDQNFDRMMEEMKELEGSVSKSGGPGNSDGSPGTEQLSETV